MAASIFISPTATLETLVKTYRGIQCFLWHTFLLFLKTSDTPDGDWIYVSQPFGKEPIEAFVKGRLSCLTR